MVSSLEGTPLYTVQDETSQYPMRHANHGAINEAKAGTVRLAHAGPTVHRSVIDT